MLHHSLCISSFISSVIVLYSADIVVGQQPYAFDLPIKGLNCGGFSYSDRELYLFQFSERQLYKVSRRGRLSPSQHVKGWYVVDVDVVGGTPIYCSRGRVFERRQGKIKVRPISNTKTLIAICSDIRNVYLLDIASDPTVITLDRKTGREVKRFTIDVVQPEDMVVGDGDLWVLDQANHSILKIDRSTGETLLRCQAGPGVKRRSQGLLFREGALYVHEGQYSRLRRVDIEVGPKSITSWSHKLKVTFVQQSANEHDRNTTTVNFLVPIPPDRPTQTVSELEWSQRPNQIVTDAFGQKLARFSNIKIPPKREHELRYTMEIEAKAVQYDPPRLALSTLESIDPQIRKTYLADNKLYQMNDREIQKAAKVARAYKAQSPPTDVRTLIENIAHYVVDEIAYKLDDSWNNASTSLKKKEGSCSEYSFLFSALCRLNGIPTRLVGGIEIGDYAKPHETRGFHRWTEVYFPTLGWIPVDVTKIDGAKHVMVSEFLFGTPGYVLVLSQGDFDLQNLGMTYYIRRSYRGGKRKRSNVVRVAPADDKEYRTLTMGR